MGVSCQINSNSGYNVTFDESGNEPGRHLINLFVGDPQFSKVRFHVSNVEGNAIIRNGQLDRRITLHARYIGTQSSVKQDAETDRADWANNAVVIVDEADQSFYGMNLVEGSWRETRRTTCVGPLTNLNGGVFMEIMCEFRQDAPYVPA